MRHKDWIERTASVILILLIWQIAAMSIAQPLLLASPLEVLQRLTTIWMEEEFASILAFSFSRIATGLFISLFAGIILAVIAGKVHAVELFLWPLILMVKTVPVVAIILMLLIWMTSSQLTAFIILLTVLPIIYTNMLEGIKSTDPKMMQMAQMFDMPFSKRLLYIYLPQIKPFLFSACSVSLGTAWKVGVAAEVLSIPDGSIGEAMYKAKVYFLTCDLFTWTIIVVLLSLLFEKAFMAILALLYNRLERL